MRKILLLVFLAALKQSVSAQQETRHHLKVLTKRGKMELTAEILLSSRT